MKNTYVFSTSLLTYIGFVDCFILYADFYNTFTAERTLYPRPDAGVALIKEG